MIHKSRSLGAVVGIAVLALALAACSGGDPAPVKTVDPTPEVVYVPEGNGTEVNATPSQLWLESGLPAAVGEGVYRDTVGMPVGTETFRSTVTSVSELQAWSSEAVEAGWKSVVSSPEPSEAGVVFFVLSKGDLSAKVTALRLDTGGFSATFALTQTSIEASDEMQEEYVAPEVSPEDDPMLEDEVGGSAG